MSLANAEPCTPCYSFYVLGLQNTCQASVDVFKHLSTMNIPMSRGENQWPLPNFGRKITSAEKSPGSWPFGYGNPNLVQAHGSLFDCVH